MPGLEPQVTKQPDPWDLLPPLEPLPQSRMPPERPFPWPVPTGLDDEAPPIGPLPPDINPFTGFWP